MNDLSYKYFVAVANAESIKAAADALMLSPQALGEHMRKLEREVGAELFTHTRPVRLSPSGERFRRYAESMLFERHQLERDIRDISEKHREIVISVSATDFPPFLTDVIADFSARFPTCIVTVTKRSVPVNAAELRSFDFNFSADHLPGELTELLLQRPDFRSDTADILNTSNLSVLVHQKLLRRLWGQEYDERLENFQKAPLLTAFRDIPFIRCLDPDHDGISDRLFMESGFLPTVSAKSESMEICRDLCLSGVGALILSDGWAMRKLGPHINETEMMLFRLPSDYPQIRTILSYQKRKVLTLEEQAFITMIQEAVSWPKISK